MRVAIGLFQAIMMILIVSGILMVVLKYASISSKHIADSYVREQNELFLNSAIEQALLAISFHDRSGGCLETFAPTSLTKRGITYSTNISITKYYFQRDGQNFIDCNTTGGVSIESSSELSEGMALFEVESKATKADGTVVSRILRRTLQQP